MLFKYTKNLWCYALAITQFSYSMMCKYIKPPTIVNHFVSIGSILSLPIRALTSTIDFLKRNTNNAEIRTETALTVTPTTTSPLVLITGPNTSSSDLRPETAINPLPVMTPTSAPIQQPNTHETRSEMTIMSPNPVIPTTSTALITPLYRGVISSDTPQANQHDTIHRIIRSQEPATKQLTDRLKITFSIGIQI